MSYMRSASSKTTKETRVNASMRPCCMVNKSMRRPGVATIISAPLFKSAICSATRPPPYTFAARMSAAPKTAFASRKICSASSLAGAITNTIGPWLPSKTFGWSAACRTAGNKNAKVFPEPVFATPMTSRPHISAGIACFCTGNGVASTPKRASTYRATLSGSPHWRNVSMGGGQPLPLTLISSSALRASISASSRAPSSLGATNKFLRIGTYDISE
mmetsp:Transcript_9425/g.30762  ORF Transcript_9425/g.30762 Transcript_9425/m.30762 type:complete len:217 (-) Transcript_9425:370-1020(-)